MMMMMVMMMMMMMMMNLKYARRNQKVTFRFTDSIFYSLIHVIIQVQNQEIG